jgi:uncharacterized repeat protein (TIGR03803 family)
VNGWKAICLCSVLCLAVAAAPAQTFTSLGFLTDGSTTVSALIQARDGNFYGTSQVGGVNAKGSVFEVTPGGTISTLYSFCSQPNCVDGWIPVGALVLGIDGDLYGTTQNGGSNGMGVVFKITTEGLYTVLHSFDGTDGNGPESGLALATDGNFYGTTFSGGSYTFCTDGCGTVFKMTPDGALTTLHTFVIEDEGIWPNAPVVQGTDGSLYGTTYSGGDYPRDYICMYGCGTVFRITTQGTFTVLHKFDYSDGSTIYSPVAQGADGSFYGTAFGGGYTYYEGCGGGCGTLFKVTSSGVFTKLHTFSFESGGNLYSGLAPATDGNLYGEGTTGGIAGYGDIFKLTPAGGLTAAYSFFPDEGGGSTTAVVQATDGKFYGSYYNYIPGFFSLGTGLGPFVAFVVPGGKAGATAQILGQGFTGASSVTFNGVPAANFTVVSDTYLTAVVPAGATTGMVVVDTPSGALNSNVSFRVTR